MSLLRDDVRFAMLPEPGTIYDGQGRGGRLGLRWAHRDTTIGFETALEYVRVRHLSLVPGGTWHGCWLRRPSVERRASTMPWRRFCSARALRRPTALVLGVGIRWSGP